MEFKAAKGYNLEILRDFKFRVDTTFQYHSDNFYEPIIVNDVEAFNKSKLNKNEFDKLKSGGGFELKSVISCAIPIDDDLFGIINIDNCTDIHMFSEDSKPLNKKSGCSDRYRTKKCLTV